MGLKLSGEIWEVRRVIGIWRGRGDQKASLLKEGPVYTCQRTSGRASFVADVAEGKLRRALAWCRVGPTLHASKEASPSPNSEWNPRGGKGFDRRALIRWPGIEKLDGEEDVSRAEWMRARCLVDRALERKNWVMTWQVTIGARKRHRLSAITLVRSPFVASSRPSRAVDENSALATRQLLVGLASDRVHERSTKRGNMSGSTIRRVTKSVQASFGPTSPERSLQVSYGRVQASKTPTPPERGCKRATLTGLDQTR